MPKLISLDILRVIAIFFILITHSGIYISNSPVEHFFSTYFASFGIALFVFVSGYSLYLNNNSINSFEDILKFYKKRLLRIFPLYWLALISFIIIFWFLVPIYAPSQIVNSYQSELNSYFTIGNMAITFFGLEIFLSPEYATPIFTLWYIGLILIFYFLFPILIRWSKNSKELIFHSILVLIFFLILRFLFNIIDIRFFNFYFIFIIGILACRSQIFINKGYSKFLILLPSLMVFSLILDNYVKTIITSNIFGYFVTQSIFFTILASAFCIIQFYFASSFSENFTEKTILFIGSIAFSSYCVYLFHRQFLTLVYGACYFLHFGSIISNIVIIFIGIPILFVGSFYFQKIVNKIGF
jgi:peptidoglycan/LPS O-acetylase OafA/YrhL